ncbi:hypothetical protein F5Y13DRAFT_24700 [Hypoxylon sp. FL1857]|nr:hypothetical protein F5Y13DRAFT_24700 [Hypoxylon sp. FL1857]
MSIMQRIPRSPGQSQPRELRANHRAQETIISGCSIKSDENFGSRRCHSHSQNPYKCSRMPSLSTCSMVAVSVFLLPGDSAPYLKPCRIEFAYLSLWQNGASIEKVLYYKEILPCFGKLVYWPPPMNGDYYFGVPKPSSSLAKPAPSRRLGSGHIANRPLLLC